LRLPLKGLDFHACQKTQQYNDSLVMVNNMSAILQSRLEKHMIYRCKHGEKYPPASITSPSPKLRFAAAWASIANVPPSIPSETDYKMRLISKWTRNGKVPTIEEAETMERASG